MNQRTEVVTQIEIERMADFVKQHGKGLYNLHFYPTGIATGIHIENSGTGIKQDISDYDSW